MSVTVKEKMIYKELTLQDYLCKISFICQSLDAIVWDQEVVTICSFED
jgi:hypothetical protein